MGTRDRRRVERRGMEAFGTGALLATLALAGSPVEAQIYTRRNDRGVMEATNAPEENDYKLAYPGKGTLIHSAAWRLRPSYSGEFDEDISAAASHHGVSVELVRAVIQVESDFDHLAISSKGAQGLMQLMPDTARRMGVTNAFDPRQNIFGGVRYLRFLLDLFRGDIQLVAAAYNAGENAVTRYGGVPPYKETRGYVEKVQTLLGLVNPAFGLPSAQAAASFFAPNPGALQAGAFAAKTPARATTTVARRTAFVPLRPRVYYKWADGQGVVHLTQAPPAEGVTYTMIRALD
jgi:transglycosylase-like protein with SLT domain